MDLFNKKKLRVMESQMSELAKALATANSISNYYAAPIYRSPYTGEKTPGEMGAAKDYTLIYEYLRVRSWQAFLDSEIAQIVINKYCMWVVGNGLKVQPEPSKDYLSMNGININENFVKQTDVSFNLFTTSIYSDSAKMSSIDSKVSEIYKNAIVGGDCLVVTRVVNGLTEVQIIDGSHVCTPFLEQKYIKEAEAKGNRIEYGIELNESNEHVAYYVLGANNKFYKVNRYGEKSGAIMAWMVYGSKYRLDNVRGLPLLSATLETLKKLERYKEATVGSAEERQKIVYSVEHNADSTGENPLLTKLAQSNALGMGEAPETKSTDEYEAASTKVATTTNKQSINMPVGASLKLLESRNELYFKDFYTTNIQLVCASVGIPFEVALSMYNSNYSASRAAVKDWEKSMKFAREKFSEQFYKNLYNLWLDVQILNGKIQADGYIKAYLVNDYMILEAYRNARWLGDNVPHIDPLKEVMAERLKLGDDTTPLTTFDQATENLGTGDFVQNMDKIKQEKKLIPKEEQEPQPNQKIIKQLMKQEILNLWPGI